MVFCVANIRMCARGAIFPEAYDLQFVRVDPDFFFERRWYRFDACLERLMRELFVARVTRRKQP
jgi:hypothetical protein